jgi:enoyl-CoA hydratase/carnithine racemase
MTHEQITLQRRDAVATVVLDRPEKLNAMTKPMWLRLGEAFKELAGDESLRCVLLRGAGGRAFSPGNDIGEFETERANVAQARAYGAIMHATLAAIRDCPVPVVAMIQGICVGGGLEIAALADLRICGRSSRFGVPINRLGLVMAYPEVEGLLALVGPAVAKELLFEARILGAEEALAKGLVNRMVEDDAVEAEAEATAARIAGGAPLVNRWHKAFIRRLASGVPLTEAELDEGFACFGTEDFQIGYRAFLAKATPDFKGR